LRSATTVDESLFQDYLEELASGALSRLMKIPGQPWSNPQLGAQHETAFQKAISSAAIAAAKSYTRVIDRVELRGAA
jgi:hypothetical protein